VLGIALVLTAPDSSPAAPALFADPVPGPPAASPVPGTPLPSVPEELAAGPPTRIRIPGIGVDSPLESLTLDSNGSLTPPNDFAKAGWYADGTKPGDIGPAIIAGHVDSKRGPAVFYRLYQLRPGDVVEVARGDLWVTFRVVATVQYAKNRFPTQQVYGPTPDPQLRLVTCGGSFNRKLRSYVDNIIVYAAAAAS